MLPSATEDEEPIPCRAVASLFNRGALSTYLGKSASDAIKWLSSLPEDELLERSADDLVADAVAQAHIEPVTIGDEWVDGGIELTTVNVPDRFDGGIMARKATRARAVWEFTGDRTLFGYQPSTHLMSTFEGNVGADRIEVATTLLGHAHEPDNVRAALEGELAPIRKMIAWSNADAERHNAGLVSKMTVAVERRRSEVLSRRGLAGSLGFPLTKQADAPRPVPLAPKRLAITRPSRTDAHPYADEPALSEAQFNEALEVVCSSLVSMERTPSVASGMAEEHLRDQILVALGGTFGGGVTGESFVQKGKTDILLEHAGRHVFVGECKWWSGPKGFSEAIDQLLGYLTWRHVKASLILFVDRKDATAVMAKAEESVRSHPAFKRFGTSSTDPTRRRNYVLGHLDDPNREIHLAVLFAVLPKD